MSLHGRALGARMLAVCVGVILGIALVSISDTHARYSLAPVSSLGDWRIEQLGEREAHLTRLEEDFGATGKRTRERDIVRKAIEEERSLNRGWSLVDYLALLALAGMVFSLSYGLYTQLRRPTLFHLSSSLRRLAYGLLPLLMLPSLLGVAVGLVFFFIWPSTPHQPELASASPGVLKVIDPYGIGLTYAHVALILGALATWLLVVLSPVIRKRGSIGKDKAASTIDTVGIMCGALLLTMALRERFDFHIAAPMLVLTASYMFVALALMALVCRCHNIPLGHRLGLSVVSALGAGELGRVQLINAICKEHLASVRSLVPVLLFQRGATIALVLYVVLNYFVAQEIALTLSHVVVTCGLVVVATLLIGRSPFVVMVLVLFLAPSFGYHTSDGAYLSDHMLLALPLAIACDSFVSFMLLEVLNPAPKERVVTGEESEAAH